MADVSVQMGVSGLSQFKTAMTQAQTSVKTLDQQLKANESQLKATGNAEVYMTNKAGLLQKQLQEQKSVVANANKALEEMRSQGLDSTNKEFAKMEQTLAKAMAKMFDIQTAINEVGTESLEAAEKTEQLSESLGGLNKKVSLDQVIRGIDSITGGMEKAAKKAVELGKSIWDNIMDSAAYADDTATMAARMGLTIEEVQQMQYVANRFEAPVETVAKAWKKVKMSMSSDSDEIMEDFRKLGLTVTQTIDTGFGLQQQTVMRYSNYKDVFWAIGEAIMKVRDEEEQERMAQKLLGRSWDELIPLFKAGRKAYEDALDAAPTNSEDAINNAADLNAKVEELEQSFRVLKTEVIGDIAPALTKAAEVLDGMLKRLLEYLQKPEGKKALEDMAKAVEGIFSDISNIEPEQVVQGFADVFNKIVGGLQWLEQNSGAVVSAMETIVKGWAALKITDGALKILQLVQGIRGLTGGSAAASAAGRAAGASWGSGFASAVMAAAPWLIGIYTLLNPAETGDDGFRPEVDETGAATQYGMEKLKSMYANPNLTDEQKGMTQWDPAWEVVPFVADVFGQMSDILNDPQAAGAILRFGDDITGLVEALEGLGYEKNMTEDQYSEYLRTRREEANAAEEASGSVETLGDQADTATSALQQVAKEGETTSDDLGDLAGKAEAAAAALGSAASAAYAFGYVPGMSYRHGAGGLGGLSQETHANGLWSVPFDGYSAILHKGERVVPAREVGSSRNFSSNLYVESMYMNNGTDAEGLAAAMAAANRRTMRGFGS